MEQVYKFASEQKNLTIAENLIDDLSLKYALSSEIYGNILISVVEAVNNAIKHGNDQDPTKMVTLTCSLTESFLSFKIADEGAGFDPNVIPDPTLPENLEKPHGRGIFLMYNLADEVNFNATGSEVELKFSI